MDSQSFPSITPETNQDKEALLQFIPLAEMVARKEMRAGEDFRELVNLGLIKINDLIGEAAASGRTYNPSYIVQGIVWEIRNKGRRESHQRGEARAAPGGTADSVEESGFSLFDIQEAVLETVASLEDALGDLEDEEAPDPAEAAEISEMRKAVREAVALLPDNQRRIVEMKFFQGWRGVDIASELNISSARVTRVVHEAVSKIRQRLSEKRLL